VFSSLILVGEKEEERGERPHLSSFEPPKREKSSEKGGGAGWPFLADRYEYEGGKEKKKAEKGGARPGSFL